MPTVNFYSTDDLALNEQQVSLLKSYIADKLSGSSRQLKSSEISLRLIKVNGGKMIGDLEVEITAHGYKERIESSDNIATEIANFLQEKLINYSKVLVWLQLPELGHTDIEY